MPDKEFRPSEQSANKFVLELDTRFFVQEAPTRGQREAADLILIDLDDHVVSPMLSRGEQVTVDTLRDFYSSKVLHDISRLAEPTQEMASAQFKLPSLTHLLGAAKRRLSYYVHRKQLRPYQQPHLEEYITPLKEIIRVLREANPEKEQNISSSPGAEPAPTEPQRANANHYLTYLYYTTAREHTAAGPQRAVGGGDIFVADNPAPYLVTRPMLQSDITAAWSFNLYDYLSRSPEGTRFDVTHLLWTALDQLHKFEELSEFLQTNEFDTLIAHYRRIVEQIKTHKETSSPDASPQPSQN